MSKPDRSENESPSRAGDDGRDELQRLFDAIGEQLSDADRRHAAAVDEMQSRISDLAHEAETLREHVPEPFTETFGRIEKGVAELAKRLGNEAGEAQSNDDAASSPAVGAEWDRKTAEDLDSFFQNQRWETGGQEREPEAKRESVFSADIPSGPHALWLEERFSEIAKGIEHALTEFNPDSGWSQIGERFDHLEQHITNALEGVAMRSDLGAVRLIEAHVGEVVNHLAETQQHLTRLDVIEKQLSTISQMLGLAPGSEGSGGARFDVEAIARTAAEQAAQRITESAVTKEADGLRPLVDQMISESRAGRENTAMHLDTLQEAMIRVLDRIEAMEFGSIPAPDRIDPSPAFLANPREPGIDESTSLLTEMNASFFRSDTLQFSPDEVSITTPAPGASAFDDDTRPADRNEERRQNFIADARRAKMRLAATDDEIVITAPGHSGAFAASSGPRAQSAESEGPRPIRRPAAAAPAKSSGPSAPSPLLIVVAIAVLLLLSGLWFAFGGRTVTQAAAVPSAQSDSDSIASSSDVAGVSAAHEAETQSTTPDQRSDALPAAPATTTGPRTTLPMLGVAVDLDNPVTKTSLQRAERHQAMAALSGRLGNSAATGDRALAVPASMVPTESEVEGASKASPVAANARSSGPLDMPAATVGPLSLRLAAANGDPSAQFEVGSRFAEGKGTTQSFKDAAKWYQRSAERNFAPAQYRLGTLYERGLGLKADRAMAAQWYRRAAELGNVKAMHNLAVLSANQTDGSPDYTTAAQWFEQAAERGLADSQFNLAVLYENGLGVKRDPKQAFMWLSLAARGKDSEASKRRDILRGKMTSQDLAAAEAMASAWKPVAIDRNVNDARTAGEAWKKNPENGLNG